MLFFELVTRVVGAREVAVTVAFFFPRCGPFRRPRDDLDMATVIVSSTRPLSWFFLLVKLEGVYRSNGVFNWFGLLVRFNCHCVHVLSKVVNVSQETHPCTGFGSSLESCFGLACSLSAYPWYFDPTATKRIKQGDKKPDRPDSLQGDRQVHETSWGYRDQEQDAVSAFRKERQSP